MLSVQASESCRHNLDSKRTKWVVSSLAALVTGPSRLIVTGTGSSQRAADGQVERDAFFPDQIHTESTLVVL